MGANLQNVIQELKRKAIKLSAEYQSLKDKHIEAEIRIEQLQEEIKSLKEQLDSTKTDNHFLELSHRLASNPDSIIKSRRTISKLIRDIDKCITQLKE